MKKVSIVLSVLLGFFIVGCHTGIKQSVEYLRDSNGYKYKTVSLDPTNTRIYTLDNGLKVYMRVNKDKPRIQTYIAVKAGSAYDPADTTGLAHYLEHMLFKGTSRIGTINWDKEKPLLDKISELYEKHKSEKDPKKKLDIYKEIDRISGEAAHYAIANEYDKLTDTLGATGTNAHTSQERTVYINTIPSNELDRWLRLEKERFNELVLRLFHTELETVYEEFNRGQDSDGRKHYNALMQGLFPTHPYGTQTTLGKAEHLKTPSMINIHNYWQSYYVPNNMAICLSGDLNPEDTIKLIDKYWGDKSAAEALPARNLMLQKPILKPVVKSVYGPESESLMFAYRFGGEKSEDRKYVAMIDMILSNSKAGLIDLDLVQNQRILSGGCSPRFMNDYGMHIFHGKPRKGQTLEEVRDLLLEQIERIKKGDFEDWLLKAVINDFRLSELRSMENNSYAYKYVMSFIRDVPWEERMAFIDELESITRDELIDFANKHYKDNYVLVYKRMGKDDSIAKIEKPEITPVPINRKDQSDFYKQFQKNPGEPLLPVFVDYEKEIKTSQLTDDIQLHYIENKVNPLFKLTYIVDMGRENMRKLQLAVNYLPLIGTDKYSAAELRKEFYKLGLSFSVSAGKERSYVTVSGLESNMEEGLKLLEHVISSAKPDQEAYQRYVDGIIRKRTNSKKNKSTIMYQGLASYAKYGPDSPFKDIIQEKELRAIDPKELTDLIADICSYKHRIFYYGQKSMEQVESLLKANHKTQADLKPIPPKKEYKELEMTENKVYFVDFDMVQTMLLLISKDKTFDKDLLADAKLFNNYYGGSMSSIVFQEIRESKALAYVAYSHFSTPNTPDKSHYSYAFVGTQADKLPTATDAMLELMNKMPVVQKSFDRAKSSILRQTESERITKDSVFWRWIYNRDMELPSNMREVTYNNISKAELKDVEKFFNTHIKDKKYTFLVVGKKEMVDMEALKKLGKLKELSLEELFNY
jgi:zinc protease